MIGVIEYNELGQPKCEICNSYYTRVLTHVRQKHNMNEKEYKKRFGFDSKKGICSKQSSEKSRNRVFEKYDVCVEKNLLENGKNTRYIKNSNRGRTKEMVSEQTRIMLRNRLKTEPMISILRESGKKIGKSGLGNKKRWN